MQFIPRKGARKEPAMPKTQDEGFFHERDLVGVMDLAAHGERDDFGDPAGECSEDDFFRSSLDAEAFFDLWKVRHDSQPVGDRVN